MNQDHIHLASNTKSFADSNTIANFRTQLPRRRIFPANEKWFVALKKMTYKQSWYNIQNDRKIKFFTNLLSDLSHHSDVPEIVIKAGFFTTIREMIMAINYEFQKLEKISDRIPEIGFNQYNHIISVRPGILSRNAENDANMKPLIIYLPKLGREIEMIMGLIDDKGFTLADRFFLRFKEKFHRNESMDGNELFHGIFPADINGNFNNIYIYSNIVEHSDVSNSFDQLITSIPKELSINSFGGNVTYQPKHLIYRPLQARNFDIIEIELRDDTGKLIDFKLGNITLDLHFRKYD